MSQNNPDSLVGLGTILLSQGSMKEANLMFQQARQIDLEAVNTMLVQDKIFVEVGRNQEALLLIENVLRFDPSNNEAIELKDTVNNILLSQKQIFMLLV